MKYYMPQVIIDWKLFNSPVDPRLGTKFTPVYESEAECQKYNPGIGIVEIEQVSAPQTELVVMNPTKNESEETK